MIIVAPYTPPVVKAMAAKGNDFYLRNITGHIQKVCRCMPQKVKAKRGTALWNSWETARKTMELYRTLSDQTKKNLRPLFKYTNETYLDWFRSAYQTQVHRGDAPEAIAWNFIATLANDPKDLTLHISSKKAFHLWIVEHHFLEFNSIIDVVKISRGFPCTQRKYVRHLANFKTSYHPCGPNQTIQFDLHRDKYYSLCFTFPAVFSPAPSLFPIVSGQTLFDLFS
jgi:hypothetical protein